MMFPNGHIRFIFSEGGGFDSEGYPVAVSERLGVCVPCRFYQRSYNSLARSEGEAVTESGYTILIEYGGCGCRSERLALYDDAGREIGRFSVIGSELLDIVSQEKITV